MPLVSILMPAHNAAEFVRDALQSVLTQDEGDWELIFVDDCSTDSTYQIASSYVDRRIRILRNSQNLGPALTRGVALAAATGRYIAFLDSDDAWLPEKLSQQLSFMSRTGVGLSFTSFRRVTSDGRVGMLIRVPDRISYDELLGNTAIATSTVIVDRLQSGDFEFSDGYRYDDFILWLTLLKKGVAAGGLNRDLCRYRVLPASYSRNKARSAMAVWRIFREVEKLSAAQSALYFSKYAARALWKYRRL